MNDLQSLLNLPLGTLALLASGYLGYRVAFVGKDQAHQTVDVLFISSVFALLARMVSGAAAPMGVNTSLILGMAAAALGAAIWRKWVSGWLYRALRYTGVSQSDRHKSAWTSVHMRAGFAPTTLVVKTANGTALMCHDLARFNGFRDGPCILGEDGSVAMYVTDRILPGAADWEVMDVYAKELGTQITYIPTNQITEIRVHQPD